MSDNYTQGQLPWVTHNSVRLENSDGDILLFKTRDGRPRFELVYNLTPEQKSNPDLNLEDKSVTAPFDVKNMRLFVEYSKMILDMNKSLDSPNSETRKDYSVMCLYHYDKNGNKSEQKLQRTKVRFYLDLDNIFKMSITDVMYSGKVTVFDCGQTSWHIHDCGALSQGPAGSRIATKIYLNHLDLILDNLVKNGGTVSYSRRPVANDKVEAINNTASSDKPPMVEVAKAIGVEDVNEQINKLLAGK